MVAAILSTSFLVDLRTQYVCTALPEIKSANSAEFSTLSLASLVSVQNVLERNLSSAVETQSVDVTYTGARYVLH